MSFKIGSLFDGSGGFPLAGFLSGGVPVWASEIEPYPIAVTKSRFPYVKHLGSVTDINGAEIEPVDVITFGSPCQDLSVAGKRAGLKHEDNGDEETTRSGLFMEAVRIIKEMREATNGEYPRFALWENVPGAFSSNKGEDFKIVLEEIIKIVEPSAVMPDVPQKGWAYADCYRGDGWSIAYRVFDAQYWGVPQRRRRIYLVADFRGECAGEILFKRDGLRGYSSQSGSSWEGTSTDAENGIGTADCENECVGFMRQLSGVEAQLNMSPTLLAAMGESGNNKPCVAYPVTFEPGAASRLGGYVWENIAGTLRATPGDNLLSVAYSFDSLSSNSMKSSNPYSGCRQVDVSKCLDTTDPNPSKNQGGIAVLEPIAVATQQGGAEISENGICPTITAAAGMSGNNQPWICKQYLFENHSQDTRYKGPLDVCPIVSATFGMGGNNQPFVVEETPVYCLQGNGIDRADTAGCNGKGWKEDVCYTLNTIDRPAVVCVADHTTPKVDEKGVAFTLQSRDYKNPLCAAYTMQAFGDYKDCGVASGLKARDYKDATDLVVEEQPIALDRAFFNQGQNAAYPPQLFEDGTNPTLVARGPNAVCVRYIVRRLTPTECARLQGFPDCWGHPDHKDDFTDEEYAFWLNVRNTHAEINGKTVKDYPKKSMLTWYNKLHTDSSEYKMWGNGIALPNALYVMQGISDVYTSV